MEFLGLRWLLMKIEGFFQPDWYAERKESVVTGGHILHISRERIYPNGQRVTRIGPALLTGKISAYWDLEANGMRLFFRGLNYATLSQNGLKKMVTIWSQWPVTPCPTTRGLGSIPPALICCNLMLTNQVQRLF